MRYSPGAKEAGIVEVHSSFFMMMPLPHCPLLFSIGYLFLALILSDIMIRTPKYRKEDLLGRS